jgi:hypothetical protein
MGSGDRPTIGLIGSATRSDPAVRSDTEESAKDFEPSGVSRPPSPEVIESDPSPNPTQNDRRDDKVVSRTEHRYEVRDQVDGAQKVKQQACKSNADARGRPGIGEQPSDQANQIRDEAERHCGQIARRSMQPQEGDKQQPADRYDRQRDDEGPDHVHSGSF